MQELVDSRDVLDANARTRRRFEAIILGHFEKTGPDPWDPYRFVAQPGGQVTIRPGLKIQVEPEGAVFRVRRRGRVLRVAWQPAMADEVSQGEDPRDRFMQSCVTEHENPPGRGLRAVIAKKLLRHKE